MKTYQRRHGQEVKIWDDVVQYDNRGGRFVCVPVDENDVPTGTPQVVKAVLIPDRSTIADLAGQQEVDVYQMLIDPDVNAGSWARAEWRGVYWDVSAPAQLHYGSGSHVRHQTVEIRRRPSKGSGYGPSTYTPSGG